MIPLLSVIIPTHKRAQILRQCLERLQKQTIADQIEVIVISDGHDDDTTGMMEGRREKFFEIPKSQQGVARNKGVSEATAERILFIGDDMFLAPDACARHLATRNSQLATATLGFITWDPAVGITPVMTWLEETGWQFGYPMIAQHAHGLVPWEIQHKFTYTSQVSVPTEIARKFPFREDVSLYGWEDMEWGLRLKNAGVKLFYDPDARALHHHHMTLEDSLKRMETLGKSAVAMEKIAPELNIVPKGFKRLKYWLASLFPTMRGKHAKAFLSGI